MHFHKLDTNKVRVSFGHDFTILFNRYFFRRRGTNDLHRSVVHVQKTLSKAQAHLEAAQCSSPVPLDLHAAEKGAMKKTVAPENESNHSCTYPPSHHWMLGCITLMSKTCIGVVVHWMQPDLHGIFS